MADKPAPFVDAPRVCHCGYCTDAKLRAFIDGGLQAARDQGLPRPHESSVYGYVKAEFGASRACSSTVGNWLLCCAPWTDPWPGDA